MVRLEALVQQYLDEVAQRLVIGLDDTAVDLVRAYVDVELVLVKVGDNVSAQIGQDLYPLHVRHGHVSLVAGPGLDTPDAKNGNQEERQRRSAPQQPAEARTGS